jgi:hypothetical protein
MGPSICLMVSDLSVAMQENQAVRVFCMSVTPTEAGGPPLRSHVHLIFLNQVLIILPELPECQFEPSSAAVAGSAETLLSDRMYISFPRHIRSLESSS